MVDELDGDKRGLKAAVAATHDPAAAVPGDMQAEQLDLLPLRKMDRPAAAAEQGAAGRGPGRPAGSKNKNTEAWRDYILSRYPSPLVALAETYSRPLDQLKAELHCTALDAFKLQLTAAKELAPYLHGKMPTEVDLGDGGLIHLTINTGNARDQLGADVWPATVEVMETETQENQMVSAGDFEKSNAPKSNETAESFENQGESGGKTD